MAESCSVTVTYITNLQNTFNEFFDHFYRNKIPKTNHPFIFKFKKKISEDWGVNGTMLA